MVSLFKTQGRSIDVIPLDINQGLNLLKIALKYINLQHQKMYQSIKKNKYDILNIYIETAIRQSSCKMLPRRFLKYRVLPRACIEKIITSFVYKSFKFKN